MDFKDNQFKIKKLRI